MCIYIYIYTYSYGGITMFLYSAVFKIQGSFKGLSRVF